jgi:poly(3-hydroxyalkanoate) synthetase
MKTLSELEKVKIITRESLIEKLERRMGEIPRWEISKRFRMARKKEIYRQEINQIKTKERKDISRWNLLKRILNSILKGNLSS